LKSLQTAGPASLLLRICALCKLRD
jgi:hypothetical protein